MTNNFTIDETRIQYHCSVLLFRCSISINKQRCCYWRLSSFVCYDLFSNSKTVNHDESFNFVIFFAYSTHYLRYKYLDVFSILFFCNVYFYCFRSLFFDFVISNSLNNFNYQNFILFFFFYHEWKKAKTFVCSF